ncbi:MAG TPA: aminoglycoside phosphotransferase family protein [bacterium]|nr:aminoglycoside phosphotransferase family protein [bacterium]
MSIRPCCPLPQGDVDDALRRAFDVEHIASVVRGTLCADAVLRTLQPAYVRFKGRDGSLVGFRSEIEHGGERHASYVTVRTAPPERLRTEFERIAHRADRVHLGVRGCALLAGDGLLLLAYPIDRIVRELRHMVRASKVRGLLLEHCPAWLPEGRRISKRHSSGAPVSYKPERRAVVCWQIGLMDDAGTFVRRQPVWLRLHAAEQAPRTRLATDAVRLGGVSAPRCLAVPHPRLMIEEHVEGTPWRAERVVSGDDLAAVAQAICRVHAAEAPPELPVHDAVAELDLALRCVDDLRRIDPALGARAAVIVDRLSAHVPTQDDLVLSHGDLHPEQLLLGERVGLVDFDRACRAPRVHDLATLRAHLLSGAGAAGADPLFEAILAEYERSGRHVAAADLAWWSASALLRLAIGPFRRLRADWPAASAQGLAAAEHCLGTISAGGHA